MKTLARVVLSALAVLLVAPPASADAPDYTKELLAGETFTWAGNPTHGTNLMYWGDPATGSNANPTCAKTVDAYCETARFSFTNPVPQGDVDGILEGAVRITIDAANDYSDYDLIVFASDAAGTKGPEVARSAAFAYAATTETVNIPIETTVTEPTVHLHVEVVYFAASGGYAGSVRSEATA